MAVVTYEGIVEDGQIRLRGGVRLAERATVYVIVPDSTGPRPARLVSPRLADPSRIADFRMLVAEAPGDADV